VRHPTGALNAAVILLVLATVGCRRTSYDASDPLAASLMFDNGSPDAREALASPVDFRLTDDNFARWQEAQNNLDDLPRSAIGPGVISGRNAIDRAVARLETSPSARRAIESSGLSVRDFVLETIALAQAAEAAETGKSTSAAPIPPDNFQFVQRYRSRVLLAGREDRLAREQTEAFDMRVDTAEHGDEDTNMQMDEADTEHERGMPSADDTASIQDTLRDSMRDTIPSPRLLLLPAGQLSRGWWQGQRGYASLERVELRRVHDELLRAIQLHLRNQLLRANDARLLERVRREPSLNLRRLILPLLQQDLKQIRDSLRIVASSRHIHHAF
jgi:hypothetical protein